ncbi:hypothetical protein DDE82_001933 [Stemphylium lycopersici]|uniref:Uncharacterized protein n=1 Tax=Stemphylium lycopersici TaxID=183478 RepID=A0A364MZF2_STELY|nr:hypothetical protein DDE83_006343 [Stemphylium lycopersici]RAR09024.1 hypothetical protein DDE82_001933 [Stemphylium lycopersici]
MAASWMILGGYLILPGLYAKEYELRFGRSVLTVIVVALLTAGYSFTALLCFACRNERFQADGVFLPALVSSLAGLVSIAYNLLASKAYKWATAAITGTVLSATATLIYAILCIWTYRRTHKRRQPTEPRSHLWSEEHFYTNFLRNVYPTAVPPQTQPPHVTYEHDGVHQQMVRLLQKPEDQASPDPDTTTFRIDLPGDREEREREQRSQELVGTPAQAHSDWNRSRADSRPDSLGERQAWQQWQDRGRAPTRPTSTGTGSSHSRNLSREERRREIEMGQIHP